MRLVIQAVKEASVSIGGKLISQIKKGEMVLVGLKAGDKEETVDRMIEKMLKLRIFPDEKGLTNLSLSQIGGQILAVSQFTLYADVRDGNRPSFIQAMKPDEARVLFKYFQTQLSAAYPAAVYGVFQTDMDVSLINDGPFTVILDSEELGYGD